MLSIVDKLNEWIEPVHEWINTNHSNPIMWVAFFFIGLIVFFLTYNALSREK